MRYIKDEALEAMDKLIAAGEVFDCIAADVPFGTTNCKWDSVIPLNEMWKRLNKLIKPNGAILLNAAQPFTSILITSNLKMFKYTWVYQKTSPTGHFNAKKQPMRAHEEVVVFYKKQCTYNPQMTQGHERKVSSASSRRKSEERAMTVDSVYNNGTLDNIPDYDSTERYPLSVQKFSTDKQRSKLHPTQKPVPLMEYEIKTYTNKGDKVLDFTCGSGTTAVGCYNLERDCTCIDNGDYDGKDKTLHGLSWVNIARLRVEGILK